MPLAEPAADAEELVVEELHFLLELLVGEEANDIALAIERFAGHFQRVGGSRHDPVNAIRRFKRARNGFEPPDVPLDSSNEQMELVLFQGGSFLVPKTLRVLNLERVDRDCRAMRLFATLDRADPRCEDRHDRGNEQRRGQVKPLEPPLRW